MDINTERDLNHPRKSLALDMKFIIMVSTAPRGRIEGLPHAVCKRHDTTIYPRKA